MIFSKLFNNKPKWQNKNSNTRIEAINSLNPNDNADKIILEQLVSTDEVDLVRRAALIQLNLFECFLNASQVNDFTTVKQFSHKQLIKMLHGEHALSITKEQKRDLLVNASTYSIKKDQLESWLFVEKDTELVKEIFVQLAKPQLLFTLFNKTADESIQLFLLEQVDDITTLEKLAKKSLNNNIKVKIESTIALLLADAEKPIKLRKTIQLLLSKLLALKNINDYEQVLKKGEEIEKQWQGLQDELTILTDTEIQNLVEKHKNLTEQLNKFFVVKAEQYQQAQIAKQLKHQQQKDEDFLNTAIDSLKQALITAVFENNLEEQEFNNKLSELSDKISESSLNDNSKLAHNNSLEQLKQRFEHLPEIAQSVSSATQLISKISELALPDSLETFNERYQIFQQWLKDWVIIEKQSSGLLPQSITDAYHEIKKRWQQGCETYSKQQNKTFIQTRKMSNDIKRLLEQGKYNACFGLYKKLQKSKLLLSDEQQQKLQRELSIIDERMAEISDWEHYIATPKKQELIQLIQVLVEQPFDNPNEQAEKVKEYRKQWNLLGHADDEIDQSLNEQFNQFSEQAFAPCRTYYAEQEKIREQNHQNRLILIDKAKDFAKELKLNQETNAAIDFRNLEHQLNKLSQKWQNAGDVERSLYKQLVNNFESNLSVVKKAIFIHHDKNSVEKQQIITQAEKLLEQVNSAESNVDQIISATKSLQQKWRGIGYAGVKQENKLWQAFRKINDEIFTKRDLNKQETQLLIAEQEQLFSKSLALLTEQFQTDVSDPLLAELFQNAQNLQSQIFTYKPLIKSILAEVEKLITNMTQMVEVRKTEKKNQLWETLFNLLKVIASTDLSQTELQQQPLFVQLNNTWQKKVTEAINNQNRADRQNETLKLEIFARVSSPEALTKQRMAVQVSLMQEQMTSVNKPNLEESLIEWLLLGKLTTEDLPLIDRIEKIFVTPDNLVQTA